MIVHPRSEWTSRTFDVGDPRTEVGTVFVHHEGGGQRGVPLDKPAVLRAIEASVLGKGYSAIDYNLMVFADGDVWEGRGLAEEDAATLRRNADSISICAVGNFELEHAPSALLDGIAAAVRWASESRWLGPAPQVLGHRDAGTFATACPGRNLYAQLPAIRARLTTGGPELDAKEREMLAAAAADTAKTREFLENFQAGWSKDSAKTISFKAIGARLHTAAKKIIGI